MKASGPIPKRKKEKKLYLFNIPIYSTKFRNNCSILFTYSLFGEVRSNKEQPVHSL